MLQDFRSGKYYRQKVEEHMHHFEWLLLELKNDLPSSGPQKFADANIQLLEYVRKFFLSEMQQINSEKKIVERCQKYLSFLRYLAKNIMPFLDRVNEIFIPEELLLTFADLSGELAKKLHFSEKIDLRFFPRWDLNYGIRGFQDFVRGTLEENFPANFISTDIQISPESPEWFVFITYPRSESRNSLLHPNLIHELGHLVDLQTGISKAIKGKIKIPKRSFTELLQQERQKPDYQADEEDEQRQKLIDEYIEITEKWLSELISDLVATNLLGPAFFFAFFELSNLTSSINDYSKGHPSSGLRLRFILEELYQMYVSTKLITNKELKQALHVWYLDLKEKEENGELVPRVSSELLISDPNSKYFKLVYDTMLYNRSIILQKAREKIKVVSCDADKLNLEVIYLLNDMVSGKLPCEWLDNRSGEKKASDLTSILNAGWLAYLTAMDKFYCLLDANSGSEKLKALDNFNELLLKAIESGHILAKWPGE